MIWLEKMLIFLPFMAGFSISKNSWPRPQNLVAFWPFDDISGLEDVAGRSFRYGGGATKVLAENPGPFGIYNSSVSVQSMDWIAGYLLATSPMFTISFFLKTAANRRGAVLQLYRNGDLLSPFSVVYDKPDILEIISWNETLGRFPVVQPEIWNFFAVSYRDSKLEIFKENATVVAEIDKVFLKAADVGIEFGFSWGIQREVIDFSPKDALACVMYYNTTLTPEEISQLPHVCQLRKQPAPTTIVPLVEQTDEGENVDIMEKLIPKVSQNFEAKESTDNVMKKCGHFDVSLWSPPPQFADDPNKPIPIDFGFSVEVLNYLSNTDESISVKATMIMSWSVSTCPSAVTPATSSDGSEMLKVADPTQIWQPPFVFLNNERNTKTHIHEDFLVLENKADANVNRSFSFYLIRISDFTARCALDLSDFPFDRQNCYFLFVFNRASHLVEFSNPIFTFPEMASETTEWKLIGKSSEVGTRFLAGITVSRLTLRVQLERKAGYYIKNLYIPATALSMLLLITFLLPPNLVQRPLLTVTVVLSLTVAQGNVLRFIPQRSEDNLMSQYVDSLFWMAIGSVMYHSASVWMIKSVFNEEGETRKMPKIRDQLQLARVFDIIAFIATLLAYIGFNLKFFSVVI